MHHNAPIDLDLESDASLLEHLTGSDLPKFKKLPPRRDAFIEPLMLAAVQHKVTRHHYAHDFFPPVPPNSESSWDWTKWKGSNASKNRKLTYVSKQAPRSTRLALPSKELRLPPTASMPPAVPGSGLPNTSEVVVKCMARTRIPTPHGPAFLHLYHNNRDSKEHLAIVMDPAQYVASTSISARPIRSKTLDAVWSDNETEMDRITRGAYVGRLSATSQHASKPSAHSSHATTTHIIPAPLVRIHSECFTGETIGSMRCDCGEQLDEAMRLIAQPIPVPPTNPSLFTAASIPGRGAVVYLRQEGRGIGLLSKIRAYNLQDLGHDTVTANLMLGHGADERGYEIAAAILRDLGLGDSTLGGESVKLLTNNPDKVEAMEKEGVHVVERVQMMPRSWQMRAGTPSSNSKHEHVAGATLIGGNTVHGPDLDKYIRTKVLRMGHMLPLWLEDQV